MRRAYVCLRCRSRVFLRDDEPATRVPNCEAHGPMVRQANVPYRGVSTEPGLPVPPAKDFPERGGS